VDSTETPFVSRAIFNTLLNENLGFIIRETSSVWGLITGDINDQTDLQTVLNGKFDVPTGDATQYIAGDGTLITFPVAGQAGTLVRQVRNTTGATLTKGTIVYINGANGNKPTIAKALATSDATSAQTFGFLQSNISNNSNGFVVVIGDLAGLDTSSITEGTQLYLSSTVAGEYTTTKQVAPAHLVYVGIVTRSHPTQGQIEVKIQNGYELDELHDVLISGETDGQVLQFESASGLWKNKTLATGLTVGSTAISGGVDGRVLFQNGGVLQESANLTIETTPLGILSLSSSTPSTRLRVISTNASPNAGISLMNGSVSSWSIASYGANMNLTFYNDFLSSDALFITRATNNIGIGQTSPTARLDILSQGALSTDLAFRIRNSANTADLLKIAGNGQAVLFNNSANSSLSSMDATNTFVAVSLENFSFVNTTFKKVLGIQSYAGSGIRYLTMSNLDDLHWSHRFTIAGRLTTSAGISSVNTSNDFNSSTIVNLYGVNLISQASISMRPDFNLVLAENNLGLFIAPSNTLNPTKKLIKLMDSTLTTTYFAVNGSGQTSIGTTSPVASAKVQIDSTTQGFLPPRMTNAQRTAIATPAVGLMVYCTDATEGLYIYKSTGWTFVI
jgi:hypothetical protein